MEQWRVILRTDDSDERKAKLRAKHNALNPVHLSLLERKVRSRKRLKDQADPPSRQTVSVSNSGGCSNFVGNERR
jgi:hypothetical protein